MLALGDWAQAGHPAKFQSWGFAAAMAGFAATLGLLATLRSERCRFDIATVFALSTAVFCWVNVVDVLLSIPLLPKGVLAARWWITETLLLFGFIALWQLGNVMTRESPRLLGARFALISLVIWCLLPNGPLVEGPDARQAYTGLIDEAFKLFQSDNESSSTDEEKAEERNKSIDVEAIFDRQAAMVDAALARLDRSRDGGDPKFYFVSAGLHSEPDVFKLEATSARSIFDERMGSAGRSMQLINHAGTVNKLPLANGTNIERVLKGLGQIMDAENDVLVLFLTSHGTKGKIAVSFPRFALNDLTPKRLAAMLDRSEVRNRVVILSACHSGSFIKDLEGPNTLVVTAAHAEKTSFGCEPDREWTYFGDAFFNGALRSTHSLIEAFEIARKVVASLERVMQLPPSEPQISVGAEIRPRLDAMARKLEQANPMKPASAR